MGEVSLEMPRALMQRSLEEQSIIRREVGDMRTIVLGLLEKTQRLDRRITDLDRRFGEFDRRFAEFRDDIELMIKAELMGRLGHFESRIDHRLAAFEDRFGAPG